MRRYVPTSKARRDRRAAVRLPGSAVLENPIFDPVWRVIISALCRLDDLFQDGTLFGVNFLCRERLNFSKAKSIAGSVSAAPPAQGFGIVLPGP
jgi:hypothetical protein